MDGATLLYQMLYYFPWYVGLVLVPMVARVVFERAIGIHPEDFEARVFAAVSYESAFRSVALTVLYYPLFEELLFRGLPWFFFGWPGLLVGSTVWVTMHPAWQLQYLSSYPTRKKIAFTASSTAYYAANAAFYSMMWAGGAGLAAILYHIIHNGWLTLGDMIRQVELPAPWKKYRFVREQPVSKERIPVGREKAGEEEEPPQLHFVVRKPRRSLAEEAEEAREEMAFVRRKVKKQVSPSVTR